MKSIKTLLALSLALVFAQAAWALPNIKVLATGGTIAGAQASAIRRGLQVRHVLGERPYQGRAAAYQCRRFVRRTDCEHRQPDDEPRGLAQARRPLQRGACQADVDGIVITHGTDTMEETAYFLSLVVKSDKPVVLVGSMRPATAISADGPINLYNAVALAANPEAKGRGPLVVLNDTIHYAREAQKMHTTRMDTFQSPNRGIAGMMNTGKAFFYSMNTTRHTTKSEFSVDGKSVSDLPRVDIVYSYADLGGDMIDALVAKGVKGIILDGVGDGNTTDAALAALEQAAKKGVAVVRCSRTGSGVVDRNVEVNDDKLGFIAGMELSAQKARILLMLGLMQTADIKKLQQYFVEY